MKKVKSVILPFMFCMLCSCAKPTANDPIKIKKVTKYVYETTIDYEYDYFKFGDLLEQYLYSIGGCSSASVGSFRGRNYDWTYDDSLEFVVRTTAKKDRHASLGVAGSVFYERDLKGEEYHKEFDLIPFLTLDGVNDAGLFVSVNVVPNDSFGEISMKTESTDNDLNQAVMTRMVLDKCEYLSDVIPTLEQYDWWSITDTKDIHLMVTAKRSANDPTVSTSIFELIPFNENGKLIHKVCAISNNEDDAVITNGDQSKFYKIETKNLLMTNFNLWNYHPEYETRNERLATTITYPEGYERYELLEELCGDKDSISLEQMQETMSKLFYSNRYNLNQSNYWYTEDYITNEELMTLTDTQRNPNGNPDNLYKGEDNRVYNSIMDKVERWNNKDRLTNDDFYLWETVHTTIYDYSKKSLRLISRESKDSFDFVL